MKKILILISMFAAMGFSDGTRKGLVENIRSTNTQCNDVTFVKVEGTWAYIGKTDNINPILSIALTALSTGKEVKMSYLDQQGVRCGIYREIKQIEFIE